MEFRLALRDDLPQIKAVYGNIVQKMKEDHIPIWDEIYPCEFFEEDIENHRLYVLKDRNEIASAFALCGSHAGSECVKWAKEHAAAVYLDRFGVHPGYLRKGVGSLMLLKAAELAREQGAGYIRLFVVDINEPAIRLYEKCGFIKADGGYDEIIDEDLILHEYGYELNVSEVSVSE